MVVTNANGLSNYAQTGTVPYDTGFLAEYSRVETAMKNLIKLLIFLINYLQP